MLYYYGNTTVGLPPKRKEENRKEIEEKRIEVKEIYNTTCTKLPQVQKLTDKRKTTIDKFLKEFTIEDFRNICNLANNNSFLIGENERKWKADFDFLMRIDKATNILEGKYSSSSGMNDFQELMKEAQNEQSGNNTSNNTSSW